MKFVKIDPPGTFCCHEALRDVVKKTSATSFVDIGCGGGDISKMLCSMGMQGIGMDFSPLAIATTRGLLAPQIESGQYRLIEGDATEMAQPVPPSDIGISFMVMEHVEDDVGFVRTLSKYVRPGGYLLLCVPGRKDCWTFEDETVGHLRRYDRDDLRQTLEAGGLEKVEVWSVAVPVANMLLRLSDMLVRRSGETKKLGLSQREQTQTSGIRAIPWKTVFPSWVRIILNRYTLYPLFVMQRLFYRTGLGITMLGFGRVRTPA